MASFLSELGDRQGNDVSYLPPRHVATAEEIASAAGQSAPAEGISAKAAAADHTGHGTVLLVEDEEGLRGLNARGSASRRHAVCEASNGVEAIALIEAGTTRRSRRLRCGHAGNGWADAAQGTAAHNPALKIIFVSGYAEEAFAKNLPEGGQFAFLAKPFALDELVAGGRRRRWGRDRPACRAMEG